MSLAYNSASGTGGILELDRLCFSYEKNSPFIDSLSLAIGEGEFIGLLGSNGSGKSTILRLASGILRPTAGTISLWGKPLSSYRNRDRAKLISYLPQSLDIGVPFTLRELVGMGLYPYDIPPVMTADDALDLVGLADKRNAYLTGLSGGEQRRAFVAMTLLQGAGVLLLDEPLANLDIRYQIELVKLLKQLRETRNISIVMALHDINIALQFERVLLIKNGSILGFGKPDEVLTAERIKNAFDVSVRISRHEGGTAFISYEDSFL
jgi:iron complex transport system ATP-binding protein